MADELPGSIRILDPYTGDLRKRPLSNIGPVQVDDINDDEDNDPRPYNQSVFVHGLYY